MAKIAQVSAKYIVHAKIFIEGVVDRPDVIGAIFGQTEGLLGADLELRELQKSGRIGRIEVNVDTKGGKTTGEIIIPSSLDKAETSIVGAAIEIIQRIGPCNAKIQVGKIEDIRISKRQMVIERAKILLRNLMDTSMPDSQELSDEVAYSVRMMEIQDYGKEKLASGPGVDESDEIVVVEGRADVLNLLKHGFKNAIAINGTSIPQTILDLCREKTVTVFVDGDRGGDLIIKELLATTEIDYVTKAPDGKEVEELTKKEIHKALRSRISGEQAKLELPGERSSVRLAPRRDERMPPRRPAPAPRATYARTVQKAKPATPAEKEKFSSMLEGLIGTRGALILDQKLNILGKVPVTELQSTIKSLASGIYAVVFDGKVDKDLVMTVDKANVSFLIGMDSKVTETGKVTVFTSNNL